MNTRAIDHVFLVHVLHFAHYAKPAIYADLHVWCGYYIFSNKIIKYILPALVGSRTPTSPSPMV